MIHTNKLDNNKRKNCDIDWEIYHMLTDKKLIMIEEIVKQSGLGWDTVEASLSRLENNHLVEIIGESVRLLNLLDILILNETENNSDVPIYIENGVIKAKKQC